MDMMNLEDRQQTILEALVREYVKTAEPVSSKDLQKKYHLPFSPATIRNDFKILTDEGFISQPHISAGRVPTDKAYRFYINQREDEQTHTQPKKNALMDPRDFKGMGDEQFLHSAAIILSELSKGFTTAGLLDNKIFFKYGFSEVLEEPEFSDQELVKDFGRAIDDFEEGVDAIFKQISEHSPHVFIGKENPIKSAREYGMVVYAYSTDSATGKKKKIISILGPKRMDYEKNISLLHEFDDIVHEFYGE